MHNQGEELALCSDQDEIDPSVAICVLIWENNLDLINLSFSTSAYRFTLRTQIILFYIPDLKVILRWILSSQFVLF